MEDDFWTPSSNVERHVEAVRDAGSSPVESTIVLTVIGVVVASEPRMLVEKVRFFHR